MLPVSEVPRFGGWDIGVGFLGVRSLGFGVWGLEFWVGCWVLGVWGLGLGFGVRGWVFGHWGLGFGA